MIIRLDTLKDGSRRQSWSGSTDEVDLIYPEVQATVEVDGHTHRLRDLVTVRGNISATLERPCDRCLEPASVDISIPLHVIIQIRSVRAETEEGDDGEFIITVPEDDTEVDLTELIRHRVSVEMPMVIHCREECAGLCSECGENLNDGQCRCTENVDSRWDTLKSIDFKD